MEPLLGDLYLHPISGCRGATLHFHASVSISWHCGSHRMFLCSPVGSRMTAIRQSTSVACQVYRSML